MKVYFVASIRGKTKYFENYKKIIEILKTMEIEVICQDVITSTVELVSSIPDERRVKHYKNVLKWINSSDLIIAEASSSSLGVGFEISLALEKGKPVIVLYTEDYAPHFIKGVESERLLLLKYSMDNIRNVLNQAIRDASDQMDVRFNFFISPKIGAYLDWVAKNRKEPRAVYLRRLIEEDMSRSGYEVAKEDKKLDKKLDKFQRNK